MLLLEGHRDQPVLSLAYRPDGAQLVSGTADGEILFWDLSTARIIRQLETGQAATSLAFSNRGNRVAIGQSKNILLCDEMQSREVLSGNRFLGSTTATFTHDDSSLVFSGYLTKEIYLLELGPSGNADRLQGQLSGALDLMVSTDGKWLVSGGGTGEGEVLLWDLQKHELHSRFVHEEEYTFERPGGYYLPGAGWNYGPHRITKNVSGAHPTVVHAVAISADSLKVASGDKLGTVRLWDRASGALVQQFSSHSAPVSDLRFTTDGQYLLSVGENGIACLHNLYAHELEHQWDWQLSHARVMAFSSDGMTAAVGAEHGAVMIWDLDF